MEIHAQVPPSGAGVSQNFARNPALVNKRLSAACYRPQTLASILAKSLIDFASVAAPLPLHPDRMRPPLGKAAGIKGDHAIGFPQLIDHLSNQDLDQRAMIPGRGANELLYDQTLDID